MGSASDAIGKLYWDFVGYLFGSAWGPLYPHVVRLGLFESLGGGMNIGVFGVCHAAKRQAANLMQPKHP